MFYFCLSLCICSIVFFTCYLIFSFVNFKAHEHKDYRIQNMFPYELNFDGTFKSNAIGNICLIVACALGASSLAFIETLDQNGYLIFALISGILSMVGAILMCFIPLRFLKEHIFFDVIAFIFSLMFSLSLFLYCFFEIYEAPAGANFLSSKYILTIVCLIVSILTMLTSFIVIMNPKLTRWGNLKEEIKDDGTKTYIRPKWFVLAFSEWLILILIFINLVCALLINLAIFIK